MDQEVRDLLQERLNKHLKALTEYPSIVTAEDREAVHLLIDALHMDAMQQLANHVQNNYIAIWVK